MELTTILIICIVICAVSVTVILPWLHRNCIIGRITPEEN